MSKSEAIKILTSFLIWRLYTFLIAYISPILIPNFGSQFPYFKERLIDTNLPHFLWSFGNFDGVHYLGIAQHLYDYQYTQAFFPIYPLLIRFLSPIFLGNYLLAGLFISNAFFLLGLYIFFILIKDLLNEKTAFWSIIFILVFPTSFYFGSVYTEGLFFFFISLSFYLLSKNRLFLASIVGIFASATRLIGILLSIALIKGKKINQIIPFFIVPIGLILYMGYLFLKFHNPFYFLTAQTIFGQERSTTTIILLPQVFFRYIKILITTHNRVFLVALFELSSTIFAIAVLLLMSQKAKREWLIFSWLAILIPTFTGTLTSMPRYILMAFPIYIYLALIKNNLVKITILVIFVIILTITTAMFTQGYWVA